MYNKLLVKFFFDVSYSYVQTVDRGAIEVFGPLGIVRSLNYLMGRLNLLQTGFIYNYLFIFLLGIFFIIFFFMVNIGVSISEYLFLILFLNFVKREKEST